MVSSVKDLMPKSLPISGRIIVPVCAIGAALGVFYGIFGAKQRSRPDPVSDTFLAALPVIKERFLETVQGVVLNGQRILGSENSLGVDRIAAAVNQLKVVEEAAFDNKPYVWSEHSEFLQLLLAKPMTDWDFTKYNSALIYFGDKSDLWKSLKNYRELLLPLDEKHFKEIKRKIACIKEFHAQGGQGEFKEEDRLNSIEVQLLMNSSMRRKTLDCLRDAGIKFPNDFWLRNEWASLEKLYTSGVMKEVIEKCRQGFKPGTVYFYDWNIISIRNFYRVGLTDIVRRLIDGRIPHITIIVSGQEFPRTSHVNSAMGHHGFHEVKGGGFILGSLGYMVKLEIDALLSPVISAEHRLELQKVFEDAFTNIAEKKHSEIKLKHTNLAIRLGFHKGIQSQEIEDVELNSPQICSSYVAIVFLKALQFVNTRIRDLGYAKKECVANPFGKHEIIDRMDILRLIYHWKKLNVMKHVPIDLFVSKVIKGPKMQ